MGHRHGPSKRTQPARSHYRIVRICTADIIEDVWAEIFYTSQPTISRIITEVTPLIEKATAEFRPAADEARAAARGQTVLVDGFLTPCSSWRGDRTCGRESTRRLASTARSY